MGEPHNHNWSHDGKCECGAEFVAAFSLPGGTTDEQALRIVEYFLEWDRKKRLAAEGEKAIE